MYVEGCGLLLGNDSKWRVIFNLSFDFEDKYIWKWIAVKSNDKQISLNIFSFIFSLRKISSQNWILFFGTDNQAELFH